MSEVETRAGGLSGERTLTSRAGAELVGTAFLVAAVVGSGIAGSRLSPDDVGLQLLQNSLATGAVLVALILALQPVSAAFNPVVTLVERALGLTSTRDVVVLVPAQMLGGAIGAVVANLMFDLDPVTFTTTARGGGGVWFAEVVTTFGLVLVIFGSIRSGCSETVAHAVGAYITRGILVHQLDQLREPGGDGGAAVLRHVRRARTVLGGCLRAAPARRRRAGSRRDPCPLPECVVASGGPMTQDPTSQDPASHDPASSALPSVLFVCVHNAGRSQMAAGYLSHLGAGQVEVLSAGSMPEDQINPVAVQAMAEEGIDIAGERPTVLTEDSVRASDVVVTMGCGDACPYVPGTRYEDWELDDPAGQGIESVRPIRDQIRRRVDALLATL